MAEFMWGRDQKAVAMTETDAKSLTVVIVEAVTEAVTKKTSADALDQYRQMARLETALNQAREEGLRKDAEIAALRSHIATLNEFVHKLAPGNGASAFTPYNNNGTAVTTLPPQMPQVFIPAQPPSGLSALTHPDPA